MCFSYNVANFIQFSAFYSDAIRRYCDDGTNTGNCETATDAVDDVCSSLLNSANSSTCSGTCGTQLSAAVAACASSVSQIARYIQIPVTRFVKMCIVCTQFQCSLFTTAQ